VLPDSNVYGPVVGLWSSSNPFHSPRRATLYSLPYPLRNKQRRSHRAIRAQRPIQTGLMRQRIRRCHPQGAPADDHADMKPGGAWLARHWLV